MSIFDRFKKPPVQPIRGDRDFTAMARVKSPELRRLGGLKAYQALSPISRKLVRSIVVDGASPDFAASLQPNGHRALESQAVQRCLAVAGWVDPRLEASLAEIKADLAAKADSGALEADSGGSKAPSSDPQTVQAPVAPPETPQRNVTNEPEPVEPEPELPVVCRCGRESSGISNGEPMCAVCLAKRLGIAPPTSATSPTTSPAPTNFPDRDRRCDQCGLILCHCPKPVVLCDADNRTLTENEGQLGFINGQRVRYATLEENAIAWANYDREQEQRDRELRAEYEALQRAKRSNQ